jgi:hypothetical protein
MVMGTENAHRDFVGGTLAQKAVLRHFQQRFVEPLVLFRLGRHTHSRRRLLE